MGDFDFLNSDRKLARREGTVLAVPNTGKNDKAPVRRNHHRPGHLWQAPLGA